MLRGAKEPFPQIQELTTKEGAVLTWTIGVICSSEFSKASSAKAELSLVPHVPTQEANENYQSLSGVERTSGNNSATSATEKDSGGEGQEKGLLGISSGN